MKSQKAMEQVETIAERARKSSESEKVAQVRFARLKRRLQTRKKSADEKEKEAKGERVEDARGRGVGTKIGKMSGVPKGSKGRSRTKNAARRHSDEREYRRTDPSGQDDSRRNRGVEGPGDLVGPNSTRIEYKVELPAKRDLRSEEIGNWILQLMR
ncbi:hypothetical protein K0M31_009676 [Melipona bicolor]|uniref:Uncharacterized protein n=1 Tax=Melipona bicolor TaxID=60889 RepID=A0AA40FP30_9HYME|nr:hypothetical protein K0M31_009676 [Melipona bicolor]